MSTCAYLVVEGAIHFVHLRTEDACQMERHVEEIIEPELENSI